MDEEKGAGSISARVAAPFPSSAAPSIASSSAHVSASGERRRRFSVELRYGETNIVSWKRLVRESKLNGNRAAPSGAHPALESRMAPPAADSPMEGEQKDAPPAPNRFSAVIEKIERLYMGKESSDEEEVDDIPDDDQYDTEDSFIDDSELNEYFEVEKQATKHNGFFVNRGALEKIEPNSLATSLAPRKRRRKDSPKDEDTANDIMNMGNLRLKAAARNAPLVVKKSPSPSKMVNSFSEHRNESKIIKNKLGTSVGIYRKRSIDPISKVDSRSQMKTPSKYLLGSALDGHDLLNYQSGMIRSNDGAKKSRAAGELIQTADLTYSRLHIESPQKIRRVEKINSEVLPDLNSLGDYSLQRVKSSNVKVGSGIVRPKGTTLERAIRDLENIVSACRPTTVHVPETDSSLQVKKRLPLEVKNKLAKVARLAASQGKVKEEDLLDRLMGIVGHLVLRKTLKRNLKEAVELGLSAKQVKIDRCQQIKKEVTEMIKARIMHSKTKTPEQPDSFSDDFQESVTNEDKRLQKLRNSMDDAIEDKICDLYELYVEGMDEDKGPQMRKLYLELAELWPNGYMDNIGIKDAISRAKERRKALRRQQDREENVKRKKLAAVNAGQPLVYTAEPAKQPPLPTGKSAELTFSTVNGDGNHPEPKSSINLEGRVVDAEFLLNRKLKRKLETAEAGQAIVREKVNTSGPSMAS